MRLPLIATLLLAGQAVASEPHVHLYRPSIHPESAKAGLTMQYFGGPVLSAVKVEVVFWGPSVAPATVAGISGFLGALANSTYVDQLAQYATNRTGVNGHVGTNQKIGRGRVIGTVAITPVNTSTTLTDAAVRGELLHQITTGKLPQRDPNILYLVYFPAGTTIKLGSSTSCVQFGAYHGATPGKVGKSNLFYGVMPDCGGGFVSQTVVSSHEFAEAVSDAIPTPGSSPAYPQAWNDAGGNEIGDLCEGSNATLTTPTRSYGVQEIFTNSTNACAAGNFVSP